MRLRNVGQQCTQCLGKYPCRHAQLFEIQRHDVHICCVAEYQPGLLLEFGPSIRVSWAFCNCMFVGFNLAMAVAVRAFTCVAGIRVEPRRACAHLLVYHLSKVVPADDCVGEDSFAMCAPGGPGALALCA